AVVGLSNTLCSYWVAALFNAFKSPGENGACDTMRVATLAWVAKKICCLGSLMPISKSAATAKLSIRPVSPGSLALYQRLTVNTPFGVRRERKMRHASTV